jgi:cystathionine beta-lyase
MKLSTRLVQRGRPKRGPHPGTVNLPVARASTVTFESLAHMEEVQRRFDAGEVVPTYGIVNMPLRAAFEELMVELEGGHRAATFPSGLAAVAYAILAAVEAGDHILVTDACYGPTRRFCDHTLKRYGVEASYYDPMWARASRRSCGPTRARCTSRIPARTRSRCRTFPRSRASRARAAPR